jgi:hypothetical protein
MTKSEALLKLTQRQRDLIRLRDDERLTFREVAERLELSTGHGTKLYYEARAALDKWMATEPVPEVPTDTVVVKRTFGPWGNDAPPVVESPTPPEPVPKPTVVVASGQVRKVVVAHGVIVNTQPAPQKTWPVSVTIRT